MDADERARFSTYVISHLDKWRYESPGTDAWPALAERIGVSADQVSRWLKSQAVPSKAPAEDVRHRRLRKRVTDDLARREAVDVLRGRDHA